MKSLAEKIKLPIWAQFGLLSLAWGSSFLFIKVGVSGMSPALVVLARMVIGAIALTVVALITQSKLPRTILAWAHLTVVAVFLCVVPFSLFAWSEQHISSGMASILNATTPLMTLFVALAARSGESHSNSRMIGLALGFVGVVMLIAPWVGLGQFDLLGQLACLGATLSYGIAFNHLRKFVIPMGLSSVTIAAMHVGIGAIIMVVVSPAFVGSLPTISGVMIVSMVILGVAGTGLAYIWNTNIVSAWGATNASTVTYLSPIVGVVLGVVVLGEHLSWNHPIGALVIFAGIACSQGRLQGVWQRLKSPRSRNYQGDYQI